MSTEEKLLSSENLCNLAICGNLYLPYTFGAHFFVFCSSIGEEGGRVKLFFNKREP